jgi:putative membrane protein
MRLEPPPARAARRYVLPRTLVGLVVGGGAWAVLGTPWPLLVAPLLALDGWLDYRAGGLAAARRAAGDALAAARVVDAADARRAAAAALDRQSPLQRRARLADLAVAVGKGGHAQVRHLELPVAAELWERLRR